MSEETRRYIGKCLFCPLGDQSQRGVLQVQVITTIKTNRDINYACALGDVGRDCIIPALFKRAYEANQAGRKGDEDAIMRNTPIA